MKMKALFAVTTLALSTTLSAAVVDDQRYFTIAERQIIDITELDQAVAHATMTTTDAPTDPIDEIDVILDKIIVIGDKIWKIIEKGRPVVRQSWQNVSLVPEGVTKWQQLERWSAPNVHVYKELYKNGYGMKVVEFNYRVIFTHSGSVNGKGAYISRMEIEPALLNVAWGYTFNASGEIVNPTNAGTRSNPIAASELRMNWQVNTVFKHSQESTRFYVRGDGLFQNVSDGSMPAAL